MIPRHAFEGPPRILNYRTDPEDGKVAFPISQRSRGLDVMATLVYLDPDRERVYAHTDNILRHAVERVGLLNNRHLPVPRTTIQLSGQLAMVEHVHFGNDVTIEDVELAFEIANPNNNVRTEKIRLTSALINTGCLAGFVIETVQRNEFVTATEADLRQELLDLTEHHYDL